MRIAEYIASFERDLPSLDPASPPWRLTATMPAVIVDLSALLDCAVYREADGVFIHRGATIEPGAILKPPAIVSDGCFIGATAYLRGGIFLDSAVTVGPGSEVKSSIIMGGSVLSHLNFVGDSLGGAGVNLEAGAIVANHFNERRDKEVIVYLNGKQIRTGVTKFGRVIGDRARIGANAVLSPGTILPPDAVVGRLALVDQSLR